MLFEPLDLSGAYLIKPEKREDERGYFARSFCKKEFRAQGLVDEFIQCSISFNKRKGTLRGMHYQVHPCRETKLIRCTRGRIHDVIIDLRSTSPTYLKWISTELSEDNGYSLYVPKEFAHGFVSLLDNSEIIYHMDSTYSSDHSRTLAWNSPLIRIEWAIEPVIISEKDRSAPCTLES